MTRRAWRHCVCVGAIAAAYLVFSTGIWAQPSAATVSGEERPSLRMVRIDKSEAPTIDGDLSDSVWAKAAVLDDFRQVEPDTGQPASERTALRILYDEDNIYFGVYLYDREPDKIIVRSKTRDGPVFAEDFIRIVLDPNMTRRNGYSFEVGPAGGREDALIQNNITDLTRWNTIWLVRSRVVTDGWVAEIAIPLRDFSYDPSRTDWGFDFVRNIKRKAERDRWTSINPAIASNDISQSGTLTGIDNTNSGIGLDIKLYGRLAFKHDWAKPNPNSSLSGAGGANLYYKLAQSLTGTVTVNPDFSDAPLDERLVNTTRFSLFIPESRDFFLQDAPAFEFGGYAFYDGTYAYNAPNAQPFFSRNIGLVKGIPVTILAGGKLSGDYDGLGIGGLTVHTNRTPTTAAQDLSVVRITEPVLAESKLGFIVTNGDPTGLTRNTLAGADFQYHNSHFGGGKNVLQSDVYYERSYSSKLGEDDAFGGAINYPNEPWGGQFISRQVGRNFAPALGFVNRPGIRDYEGTLFEKTRYRDPFLRWLQFGAAGVAITGLDNQLQSSEIRFWGEVESQQADAYDLNVYNYYERVPAAFSLPKGVPVPAGEYNWTNIVPQINTTRGRWYSVNWIVECCSFYNGDYLKSDLTFIFRPNEFFEITPHYVATFIDLPTGHVAIHILSASGGINFTPDMQILLQAQFDNISRSFGFSARYRWEYDPGNEIFVSLGQNALIPGTSFEPQTSLVSIRLGHTLRF
jgi:hypothetical protein